MEEGGLILLVNNSAMTTLQELNDEKAKLAIPTLIYIGVMMILGTFGNIVVFYVYGFRFNPGTTNTFIVALAAFDLLSCSVAMPTEIFDLRYALMFPSEAACKFLRFTTFFTIAASVMTLLAIALDRHRRVCHPLKSQLSLSQVRIIVATVTVLSVILVSPILELAGIDTHATFLPNVNSSDCAVSDRYKETVYPLAYFGYLFVSVALSLAAMTPCYVLIWLTVRKRYRKWKTENVQMSRTDSKAGGDREPKGFQYARATEKTTKIMFLVTLLFVISFIPCSAVQILRAVTKFDENVSPLTEIAINIALRSFFLANSLNPFIYGYCNQMFRNECKKILGTFYKSCGFENSSDTPTKLTTLST